MINTVDDRKKFTLTGKRLRRARRLYIRLVHCACVSDASGDTVTMCVKRAVGAGLYSSGTLERDVQWSILRGFWRLTDLPEFKNKNFGWFAFCKANWYLFDKTRRKRFEIWSNQKAA